MRSGGRPGRSVRQRLADLPGHAWALAGLLVASLLIHDFKIAAMPWIGGDLLYHSALAHALLRGEVPPGGPYPGLPAYYPPGFHLLLAGTMGSLGLDAARADGLLDLLWTPVLPLTTFLLARWLTGRSGVAVAAVALTLFAGGYDFQPGRLWVNSLFLSGQASYPLYPRDAVFGLLPLAVYAFLRALATPDPAPASRWLGWAALAGLVFGICALVQTQVLLPLPVAVAVVGSVVAWRRPGRRLQVAGALLVSGALAVVMVAPWLIATIEWIRRGGGVTLSTDLVEQARFGFWSYPREFGLLLPLGLLGAGVSLLFLRQRDGPRPCGTAPGAWRPFLPEGPLVLVAWFALPFVLGVLYRPDWPLEDALRPQRLWLVASQPLAMLAAIGLVTAAEQLVGGTWRRPALVVPAIGAAILVAAVPTTAFTAWLVADTWSRPTYAHLDLEADRVPDFSALLGGDGPRTTVLSYEDWSSLVWYETGLWVVGVYPPGYAKLGYDPAIFTGYSQAERRADLLAAFSGQPDELARIADDYRATRIVLARRGDRWGTLDVVAGALAPAAVAGPAERREGNGWDALVLAPGGRLRLLDESGAARTLELEVRAQLPSPGAVGSAGMRLVALPGASRPGASRTLATMAATTGDEWQRFRAVVELQPREEAWLEALDPVVVQSVRGFLGPGGPPPGWRIALATADAVVLERIP